MWGSDTMRLTCKLGPVVAAAMSAGLLATACGGTSAPANSQTKTAGEVVPKMLSAVKSAKSVHMTGTTMSGSQTITFDMSFYGNSDMFGTFGDGSGKFSMLLTGAKMYVKANRAFLKLAHVPARACATMCGKYIKLPASAAGQFAGSLSMSTISTKAFGNISASDAKDASKNLVPASFNGQPVLKLSTGNYTFEVAGTGTPYPVLVKAPDGTQVVFSQWNAVKAPAPPPASKVLDTGQI